MRRVVVAAVATLTLSWCANATARTPTRCGLDRVDVVKRAGAVAVLRTSAGKLYSCLATTGKRKLLADVGEELSGNGTAVKRITIAGRYLAYARYEYVDGTDAAYLIDVVDARRGTRYTTQAGPVEALRTDVPDPVTRVVLERSGVVAWIYRNPFTAPVRFEVHQARRRADATLATGQTIDPSLLIVSDGLVIWRVDGQLQSAPTLRAS